MPVKEKVPEPANEPWFRTGPADFEAAWGAFRVAERTLGPTPGARERWRRGRSRYAVWIVRVDQPAVRARAAAARAALAPWTRDISARDLHITVAVAGFPTDRPALDDDVDRADLARALADLRAAPPTAPRLEVGPLGAFLSCPVLEVYDPLGELAALRARLAGFFREVRFTPYLPHVTTGLFDEAPVPPIVRAIRPHRRAPSIPLRPAALELVSFDASAEGSALRTLERVPLAIGTGS